MRLRDFFKKKEPASAVALADEKKKEKVKNKKEEEIKKEVKVSPSKETAVPIVKEKKFFERYRIVKSPQITEKATELTERNQYTFKVWPRTNKIEIKKAIESLYGVNVLSVKIINAKAKKRRLGKISGWRKGYKKAIIKIKKGQKIEVLPR